MLIQIILNKSNIKWIRLHKCLLHTNKYSVKISQDCQKDRSISINNQEPQSMNFICNNCTGKKSKAKIVCMEIQFKVESNLRQKNIILQTAEGRIIRHKDSKIQMRDQFLQNPGHVQHRIHAYPHPVPASIQQS